MDVLVKWWIKLRGKFKVVFEWGQDDLKSKNAITICSLSKELTVFYIMSIFGIFWLSHARTHTKGYIFFDRLHRWK